MINFAGHDHYNSAVSQFSPSSTSRWPEQKPRFFPIAEYALSVKQQTNVPVQTAGEVFSLKSLFSSNLQMLDCDFEEVGNRGDLLTADRNLDVMPSDIAMDTTSIRTRSRVDR